MIYVNINVNQYHYVCLYCGNSSWYIQINFRELHFSDMLYVVGELNETSAFVSFQKLQASDSGLLFTLSTENRLDMFVLNL